MNNFLIMTEAKFELIGHRGAPNLRPEHTYESYLLAFQQDADYIEFDVMPSKDGVLMVTHSFELTEISNVASVSKFSDRKKTKVVDKKSYSGWFIEDFTASELQELRLRERYPQARTTKFDDIFVMPTLETALDYIIAITPNNSSKIKLYIETKHPTYFASALNVDVNQLLVNVLEKYHYLEYTMFQSFEISSMTSIRTILSNKNIQPLGYVMLLVANGSQIDNGRNFDEYLTEEGIDTAKSAGITGFGPAWKMVTKPWVESVHKRNLIIHPYTYRPEEYFLKQTPYTTFSDFIKSALELGVDGVFTEDIDQTRAIVLAYESNSVVTVLLIVAFVFVGVLFIVIAASVLSAYLCKRKTNPSSSATQNREERAGLAQQSNSYSYNQDE
ncbi:predicted protein [Naegleria gruberi]|uniref:glycerophosphodiester phosphodiesterase n=1 Tax=Naegleria gruberi TaxID=5762 RepID=D2VDR6_NAEGR|nr:uncharacterized protein NAEGRDRAFT_48721 [Naegleria gruberi]EFC44945.1 predicted protein [Naegleria gruberi]|eukprot:XP_002677689.1 predicted protein [Naegleria gruberi strain NEG-M]